MVRESILRRQRMNVRNFWAHGGKETPSRLNKWQFEGLQICALKFLNCLEFADSRILKLSSSEHLGQAAVARLPDRHFYNDRAPKSADCRLRTTYKFFDRRNLRFKNCGSAGRVAVIGVGYSKETTFQRADFTLQLSMFVTAEKEGKMLTIFFVSIFCHLLSAPF